MSRLPLVFPGTDSGHRDMVLLSGIPALSGPPKINEKFVMNYMKKCKYVIQKHYASHLH